MTEDNTTNEAGNGMHCLECGADIPADASSCPECGNEKFILPQRWNPPDEAAGHWLFTIRKDIKVLASLSLALLCMLWLLGAAKTRNDEHIVADNDVITERDENDNNELTLIPTMTGTLITQDNDGSDEQDDRLEAMRTEAIGLINENHPADDAGNEEIAESPDIQPAPIQDDEIEMPAEEYIEPESPEPDSETTVPEVNLLEQPTEIQDISLLEMLEGSQNESDDNNPATVTEQETRVTDNNQVVLIDSEAAEEETTEEDDADGTLFADEDDEEVDNTGAFSVNIRDFTYEVTKDMVIIEILVDGPASVMSRKESPSRLIVTLSDARLAGGASAYTINSPLVERINLSESTAENNHDVILTIDLCKDIRYSVSGDSGSVRVSIERNPETETT